MPLHVNTENRPNRLIEESSPYLLQHAYNPVDWYPWGPEALEESRRSDRPILLSIGYSACHWCHVMERESFEEEEMADLMNRLFVNIKVDREERPDLDAIYMNYVQMTTGSGGWPLTVFLTPEQVPFFGGTYFPPRDHYGRPGFQRVLQQVSDAYRNRRSELESMAPEIIGRLQQAARFQAPETELGAGIQEEAYTGLSKSFDPSHGGFGNAPKFPSSMALGYLLRYHARTGSKRSLEMIETSLKEMARGGIYDQIGGGFHRYSVDERWLVPHFEKMLYDNALLTRLYLEAFQATGNRFYRTIARDVLAWVTREMTGPEGGFYSAQDADSEGEEGKYFVWTRDEIAGVLGEQDARLFCDFFGVSVDGNFEGRNILHARYEREAFARSTGRDAAAFEAQLERWKGLLLEERQQRVRPALDDKTIASWNGLMLAAYARTAQVFERDDLLGTARRNARFLKTEMTTPEGRLRRTWKNGEARLDAYLEDYAHVIDGYLHFFEASGEVEWLREASRLMSLQMELFWDDREGDFYFTAQDHEELLVRQKEFMDNATPGGNSSSCFNLLRLGHLLGDGHLRACGERLLKKTSLAMARHPLAFGNWLQALDFYLGPVKEIVVTGPPEDRARLLGPVCRRFLPNTVLVQSTGSVGEEILPMLEGRSRMTDRPALHLCQDNTCGLPMIEVAEVESRLEAMTAGGS